jgi:hypothetical protein
MKYLFLIMAITTLATADSRESLEQKRDKEICALHNEGFKKALGLGITAAALFYLERREPSSSFTRKVAVLGKILLAGATIGLAYSTLESHTRSKELQKYYRDLIVFGQHS